MLAPRKCPEYLEYIRRQPCAYCFSQPAEPHHLKGVLNLSGVGLKAWDLLAIPLCRYCHDRFHTRLARSIPLGAQKELLLLTLAQAITEGVIAFKEDPGSW